MDHIVNVAPGVTQLNTGGVTPPHVCITTRYAQMHVALQIGGIMYETGTRVRVFGDMGKILSAYRKPGRDTAFYIVVLDSGRVLMDVPHWAIV